VPCSARGGIVDESFLVGQTFCGQRVFDLDVSGLDVDDHQLGRQAVQDEQNLVQADRLAAMDFGVGRAIVTPDNFFVRRDFGEVLHAAEKNVAVGKHPGVVEFVARPGGIRPDDFAAVDDEHFVVALADVEHRVLRESVAGKVRRDGVGRRLERGDGDLGRSHRRDFRSREAIQHAHQRRGRGRRGSGRVTAGQDVLCAGKGFFITFIHRCSGWFFRPQTGQILRTQNLKSKAQRRAALSRWTAAQRGVS
jgi:hypothetical protein